MQRDSFNCSKEMKERLIKSGKLTELAFKDFGVTCEGLKLRIPLPHGCFKIYDFEKEKNEDGYFFSEGESQLLGNLKYDSLILVEGESDLFALYERGFKNVISGTGGAGTFKEPWGKLLEGKLIYIVYDNDEPGRQGAFQTANLLLDYQCEVRIVKLPEEVGHKGDVRDYFLKLGKSPEDFAHLIDSTTRYEKPRSKFRDSKDYPTINPDAFHGLPGNLVKSLIPHTESSEANLLAHFLVMTGNIVGRNSFTWVANRKVYPNFYAVIAGHTSKARKGTALSLFSDYIFNNHEWLKNNLLRGIGSGEGLIFQIRDPYKDFLKGIDDPGVEDKRLLVIEEEFASILKKMGIKDSILSPVIRILWDTGSYSQRTKQTANKATNAHLSIIAHITEDELEETFKKVEGENGFGNRFLWFAVKRSKKLPITKSIFDITWDIEGLNKAITFGSSGKEIPLSKEADLLYKRYYDELGEVPEGYIGKLCSRSEALIIKIALIYAIFDCSSLIEIQHLKAAKAIIDFSNDSCNYLFHKYRFKSNELKILESLEKAQSPLARSYFLKEVFNRNISSIDLEKAFLNLEKSGLIERNKIGRVEYWSLIFNVQN